MPPPAVCQKMMSDGAVTSYDEGQKLLDLGGDGNSPELQPSQQKGSETAGDPRMAMMAMLAKRGGGGESSSGEGGEGGGGGGADIVRLKDCHKYGKYFKMLKVRSHRMLISALIIDGILVCLSL